MSIKIGGIFYKLVFIPDTPAQDIPKLAEDYEQIISEYSKELDKRGTKFFAGNDRPGMLDLMIWPWFERRAVLPLQHPQVDFNSLSQQSGTIVSIFLVSYNLTSLQLNIVFQNAWVEDMKRDAAVQKWYLTPEIHHKFNQTVRSGNADYNMLA